MYRWENLLVLLQLSKQIINGSDSHNYNNNDDDDLMIWCEKIKLNRLWGSDRQCQCQR